MNTFLKKFFNADAEDRASNPGHIYNYTISWLIILTLIVIIFLCVFLCCNLASGIITFLLVAGASFAGGAALGFLFGLPRAEKYRFVNKDDIDHNAREYGYGDNTNLEEVSDWLTKIIVGLTLIKLNTILAWIHSAALAIEKAFIAGCEGNTPALNAYVFGYCTIILYFLAGAGLCYLWARTNLSVIFTKSKIAQRDAEKRTLMQRLQKLTNAHLQPTEGISVSVPQPNFNYELGSRYPTEDFRNKILTVYNSKPTNDKTDLQKGRWGKQPKSGDYVFEANYVQKPDESGMYGIKLIVRSLKSEETGVKELAFFLHDTFPAQIIFTVMNNNRAELAFSAYEAFVVGARLADNTELELDLNKVSGFPEGFYWKD